jgi:abortive infection bacteriophage resistance protein
MIYNKPALSNGALADLLIKRGLKVDSIEKLKKYLQNVSYYRLSGYIYPYKKLDADENNIQDYFKTETTFQQIIEDYEFDSNLRVLLLKYLESIETLIKTRINNYMSLNGNPFWYLNNSNFENIEKHSSFLCSIKKEERSSSEKFIRHFQKKYIDSEFPPSWMALELCSFGTISHLFKNLKELHKEHISNELHVKASELGSWLHTLSYCRNICAHHMRMWNRNLTIKPKYAAIKECLYTNANEKPETHKIFTLFCIMAYLLNNIDKKESFISELNTLIKKYEKLDINSMGLREDWATILQR